MADASSSGAKEKAIKERVKIPKVEGKVVGTAAGKDGSSSGDSEVPGVKYKCQFCLRSFARTGKRRAHIILDHGKVSKQTGWDSLPVEFVEWRLPAMEDRVRAAVALGRKPEGSAAPTPAPSAASKPERPDPTAKRASGFTKPFAGTIRKTEAKLSLPKTCMALKVAAQGPSGSDPLARASSASSDGVPEAAPSVPFIPLGYRGNLQAKCVWGECPNHPGPRKHTPNREHLAAWLALGQNLPLVPLGAVSVSISTDASAAATLPVMKGPVPGSTSSVASKGRRSRSRARRRTLSGPSKERGLSTGSVSLLADLITARFKCDSTLETIYGEVKSYFSRYEETDVKMAIFCLLKGMVVCQRVNDRFEVRGNPREFNGDLAYSLRALRLESYLPGGTADLNPARKSGVAGGPCVVTVNTSHTLTLDD